MDMCLMKCCRKVSDLPKWFTVPYPVYIAARRRYEELIDLYSSGKQVALARVHRAEDWFKVHRPRYRHT